MTTDASKARTSRVADLVGHTPLLRLDRIAADVVPEEGLYA